MQKNRTSAKWLHPPGPWRDCPRCADLVFSRWPMPVDPPVRIPDAEISNQLSTADFRNKERDNVKSALV